MGPETPATLFTSIAEQEERIFLGDASFATYLEEMSRVNHPLILFSDGKTVAAPGVAVPAGDFWHRKIVITEAGERVLNGEADHIALNGIDRWIGGTHLSPTNLWRWDSRSASLVTGA
jgi:hypothetical protein